MQGLTPVSLTLPARGIVGRRTRKAPTCFVGFTGSTRLGGMAQDLGWYRAVGVSRICGWISFALDQFRCHHSLQMIVG